MSMHLISSIYCMIAKDVGHKLSVNRVLKMNKKVLTIVVMTVFVRQMCNPVLMVVSVNELIEFVRKYIVT